ncbi:MAG: MATE family efflux transporter [Moraxellaceae bacterium]|nr:MATE family efflux transporter [Moraxellaceae bacterium]
MLLSAITPSPAARGEFRQLLLLLGPILVSQLSQAAYGFVDAVMAGQVSPLDLAGVAMGSSLWLPLFLLISGILMATTPLVAEAVGAKNTAEIPHVAHQALWLALLLGIAGFFLLRHIEPVFGWMNVPENLRTITRNYLEGVSWGMPAVAVFAVLRCYCEGLGRPGVIMVISLVGLLINIPANYIFIHGKFGLPAMGGAGCGWATAIVMWSMALLLLGYILSARHFASVRLLHEKSRPEWARLRTLLRLGLPIGIAIFFEVSVFCVVAILISPLGELMVAGHQIALSVTSLLFMFPLSLAICMTIRTGQAYGRRDIEAIRLTRRVGLVATTLFACLSASFIVLTRDSLTGLYTSDADVRLLAGQLLLFAAAYQICDALQVGAAGCLRGLQDTRGPMVMTLFAYWVVALPVGYTLGLTLLFGQSLGPHGFWFGLVLGLTVASVLLNWRLARQLRRLAEQPAFAGIQPR